MDVTSVTQVILSTPTQDPFPPVRGEMENLVREVFGEGKISGGDVAAAGGDLTIPAGYTISIPTREPGRSTLLRLTEAVVIAAVDNDELFATFAQTATGVKLVLDVAASTPSGSTKLGTATGTPVDTFAQDAATGGKTDLVFDPDAIHDNVAAEVSAVVEKVAPVAADLILIEDSAAANAKKRAQIGNLPVGGALDLLYVRDEKATTVSGGTFTSGADRTRDLNTVVVNLITGASLAANQVTLPNGTYRLRARAPASQVERHRAKWRNITDGTDELLGGSGHFPSTTVSSDANVWGRFTVSGGPKVFELRHRCATTRATNGFGIDGSFGETEIYAEVWIEQE